VPTELPAEFERVLRAHLAGFRRVVVEDDSLVPAAVAIVLLAGHRGRPAFLLTRRTPTLRRHAGQWALPGGRSEPGESAVEAAIRELWEEVGIPAEAVESIGLLDDYATRSGFVITPVVLLARSLLELAPNPDEVAAAYRVPIDRLRPILQEHPEGPLLRLRLLGRLINPPTAAILHQFGELALHGRHTPVDHFLQPRFTWA
jgi:8-oxo-dGTP pyrophosphatase MutT (NUDIX family)